MRFVRELLSKDGTRKVEIFERDNGTYGFEVLKFSDDPKEMCWMPYGRFSKCFASSADIAEREARERIEWLESNGEDA